MKNIYLASIKLFILHIVFAGGLLGVYNLLIKQIFNAGKLFDVLLITAFFNVVVVIGAFALAVKLLKKHNEDLFHNRHRAILLFYALIIFGVSAIILLFAILFKGMPLNNALSILACVSVFLFFYYYFLRLAYYVLILNKLRKTAIAFIALIMLIYFAALFIPQYNYKKVYAQAEVPKDFTYFHGLELDQIIEAGELENKNSALELAELMNMIAKNEKFKDGGETLYYILPNEAELKLLSDIADNKYLNFSEEYLPENLKKTGTTLIAPLNGLRGFARGIVKLSESKIENNQKGEAIVILNNLILAGNQLVSDTGDGLIIKIVGESIMQDGLGGLLKIYASDENKIGIINEKKNELTAMRDGNRYLLMAMSHATNEIVGLAKNTALFFKHYEAQKHNIGNDFDNKLAFSFKHSMLKEYIRLNKNGTSLDEAVFSTVVLIAMLPFNLNIGNEYIFYKKTAEIANGPGHEYLKNCLDNSYLTNIKNYDKNKAEAALISEKIFGNRKLDL